MWGPGKSKELKILFSQIESLAARYVLDHGYKTKALARIAQLEDVQEPMDSNKAKPSWMLRQEIFQSSTRLVEPFRRPLIMQCNQLLFPGAPPDPLYRPNEDAIIVDYYPGGVESDCIQALSVISTRNMELQAKMSRLEDHLRAMAAEQHLQHLDLEALAHGPESGSSNAQIYSQQSDTAELHSSGDTASWFGLAGELAGTLKALRRENHALRRDTSPTPPSIRAEQSAGLGADRHHSAARPHAAAAPPPVAPHAATPTQATPTHADRLPPTLQRPEQAACGASP